MIGDTRKLAHLDALRAGLAMWVFWGHLSVLCDLHVPVLSAPGAAVDCFMVISGFLMVFTTRRTLGASPNLRNALNFYVVRFFRIAPLYYLMLLVCAPVAAEWDQLRTQWLQALHGSNAPTPEPMTGLATPSGVLAHATFTFGLIPSLVDSVPLPDWSLSLEMQFYLLFPLLAPWAWQHPIGRVALVVGGAWLSWVVPQYLGSYSAPGLWAHFVQPSVILFKLNVFVCGMLMAHWYIGGASWQRSDLSSLTLAGLCLVTSKPQVWIFAALLVYLLASPSSRLAGVLSHRLFSKLGDWSYGVYLIHIFLACPLLWCLEQAWQVSSLGPVQRFAIAAPACTVLVLFASAALYRLVEQPGMNVGRRLTQRV